jgi:hypothetical protein
MDRLAAAIAQFPRFTGETVAIASSLVDDLVKEAARVSISHPMLSKIRARTVRRLAGEVIEDRPLVAVDDVLAEQLWTVTNMIIAGYKDHDVEAILAAVSLYQATPVLWLKEPTRTASSLTIPRHVLGRDVLMRSPLWFTFEVDYDGTELGWDAIYGVLLEDSFVRRNLTDGAKPGLVITWVGSTADNRLCIQRRGEVYGEPIAEQCSTEASLSIFGMLSFLNSPYIPKTAQHLSRQCRRSNARHGFAQTTGAKDEVLFVDLRPAMDSLQHDAGSSHSAILYRNRWVVRGHHRAQWYPASQAHRVIWIAPYIKGPDGAPLKASTYRVIR